MKEIRFRSIIRQVVLLPLMVLLFIMIIMIISVIIGYTNIEKQMFESNVNALQISCNQLENQLEEIDNDFIQYITNNHSFMVMRGFNESSKPDDYFLYEADTMQLLKEQKANYTIVDGVFAYYRNINQFLFRGSNKDRNIRDFVKKRMEQKDVLYNHWEIVEIDQKDYLFTIKNYSVFYWGCWISLDTLPRDFGLNEENLLGTVYLMDGMNSNSLKDTDISLYLKENGREEEKFTVRKNRFSNIVVSSKNEDIYLGMIIPYNSVIENIPFFNKLLFLIAMLSLLLIPAIIYWLQTQIASPLKVMDHAMAKIREGDLEYRIPLMKRQYYNEYDRLIYKFNQMMDDINDLEFNLYKTKIQEQKTELKYISQQIRPHFILNALNILYTYEESEFLLIKKMVLYLSEYFQYIVNLKVDYVEVKREFRHIENYLNIQKERYPDRFEFHLSMEEASMECMLPPLIMQTFIENCIKYAMKNDEKLNIYVISEVCGDRLNIRIEDTGNGFPEPVLDKIQQFIQTRSYQDKLGIGIQNAIERMDILYQERVDIRIWNADTGGACIEFTLPTRI